MAAPSIAFTNPGGIRTDIAKKDDGAVTYADVFASQPFRNQLVTLTLTGMQIKDDAGAAMARSEACRGSCRSPRASAMPGTAQSPMASA